MNSIYHAAQRRNVSEHHTFPDHQDLTRAGRVIWRRTHWSPSLCNAIAAIAGLGQEG